jgi:phosphatidylserine decarboxylase
MIQAMTSRRGFLGTAAVGAGAALLPVAGVAQTAPGGNALAAMAAAPYRVGQWLPSDMAFLHGWMRRHIDTVAATGAPLRPVILEFKELIENDPEIFMLFSQMFDELPKRPSFNRTPTGEPQVKDYLHMLQLINAVMTTAPEYNSTGLVGFPINAIPDWPMGTRSGFVAFLNHKVNAQLRKILNQWAAFLASSASCSVLGTDPRKGWFGSDARKAMPDFDTKFQCDPAAPCHGFTSWDDFFTREFRPHQRPIASPTDDAVIANACESAPYRVAHDLKRRERFWIKSQPYSLMHMLAGDELAERFVGGTLYQAFLSTLSYHRWRSPVSGTIVKTYVIDGSYYSEASAMGYDPAGPNGSQSYITDVATRAAIFIQADNPAIGLMCFLAVGMAEVSTCEITVRVGQHVTKGEQTGMFHFGGSTHCLIFGPQVKLEFDLHGQKPGLESQNINVGARIAQLAR